MLSALDGCPYVWSRNSAFEVERRLGVVLSAIEAAMGLVIIDAYLSPMRLRLTPMYICTYMGI